MNRVRLGVIGVGNMGTSHSRYLLGNKVDRCEFVAICDIRPERLEKYDHDPKLKGLSGVDKLKRFTDSKELIRSGEVDAVLVATPHYEHTTVGIDAFENGLHVLVEKPISVHKADAQRLINASREKPNLVFSAMFQMRTMPVYKRIKQFIDSGELGDLIRINWIVTEWYRTQAYYNSGGWRATWKGEGGGVLLNQCPHNLDLLQWFFGMPSRIRAFCHFGKFHDIEVEDEVTAYLEYPNGATGVFVTSTGEAPGTDRLEIAGDRGKLLFENGRLTFLRNEIPASQHIQTAKSGFERPPVWNVELPVPVGDAGHFIITQNFVDAILDGAPLIAPAEEGINSVELANAMLYSSIQGTPVEIPIGAKAFEHELQKLIDSSEFKKAGVTESTADDFSKSFR